MTGTLGRKVSTFERIINNLWILVAFIPFVNGMGIVYVGAKTSNRRLIEEGLIYEIPWMLLFLTYGIINPAKSPTSGTGIVAVIALLVLASIVISIIRSVLISPKYERMLEQKKYRKSSNKLVSLAGLIITCIPMLNGIPFIYLGAKYSDNRLKLEGAIYEIPWVLTLLTIMITPFFVGAGVVLQIISIAKFIMLNYDSDHLSFRFGSSLRQTNPETSKSKPKDTVFTERKQTNVKTEPVAPESPVEAYGHYRPIIKDLTAKYDERETKVCDFVDKHFKSSEITHQRFMTLINNSHENFYSQRNSALNIIELDSDDIILEDKIQQKISIMKMIITKMGDLQTELILNDEEDRKADENLKDLMGDMEDLINSVKDYK